MTYSLKTRKDVITLVQQGTPVVKVSRMYNIARQTIYDWIGDPDQRPNDAQPGHKTYYLEEKVEALRLIGEGGLTRRQVAELKKISLPTIHKWARDKDHILALYSSQGLHPKTTCLPNSPGEEAEPVRAPDDKDTKQHIRDLKEENEFLKAKVAYLEALMELNGTPASGFKKKSGTRPSIQSSEEASET